MQIFNSPTRYGAVAQSLHWLVVVLVILAWVLGVSDDLLPKGPAREAGLYIHITAGLLVIVLTFVRLLWRTVDPSPPAESTEFGDWSFAGWMGLGAKLAHFGLYVLLVAAPLVGIAVQFARGNGLPVFGLFEIASPWPADRAFARDLKGIHELLSHGLLALAALHAAAALVHHWVFGDRTLTRMLPGSDAGR
ncbi:cytochrome b/b6 domain-containing protein [Bradyrhizobium sediminis]|uniref:Cytochrome b/b6 domain-containing protein n=1 Tax=Bradyrhizobium sediminis TaxID=2840469 RepID=A0A975RNY0_9BRAD|nr:cytochrome b/b6 domain-containing protein [Bradyrhizobium sediminis]QWG14264.1 cytochrome b/b6 domain-containing protein [Bradyrhizobium sediminis]